MIKPTVKDIVLDFTFTSSSICTKCSHIASCKVASIVNLPVVKCRLFKKADPLQIAFNQALIKSQRKGFVKKQYAI